MKVRPEDIGVPWQFQYRWSHQIVNCSFWHPLPTIYLVCASSAPMYMQCAQYGLLLCAHNLIAFGFCVPPHHSPGRHIVGIGNACLPLKLFCRFSLDAPPAASALWKVHVLQHAVAPTAAIPSLTFGCGAARRSIADRSDLRCDLFASRSSRTSNAGDQIST